MTGSIQSLMGPFAIRGESVGLRLFARPPARVRRRATLFSIHESLMGVSRMFNRLPRLGALGDALCSNARA